jgi:hypothetical protein
MKLLLCWAPRQNYYRALEMLYHGAQHSINFAISVPPEHENRTHFQSAAVSYVQFRILEQTQKE